MTFASTTRSLVGVFVAIMISAGISLADTPDPDEPESEIEAARRPPERSRPTPEIFDLIHEIDPPADLPGNDQ